MSKASLAERAVKNLLPVWRNREKEWLTYKQIVELSGKRGVSERSVIRYLRSLVAREILEKSEPEYKKTLYKPDAKKWDLLMASRIKLVNEQEEYLCDDLKDIIAKNFEEAVAWHENNVKTGTLNVSLTENEKEVMNDLIDRLFSGLRSTLIDQYFDGKIDSSAVYDHLASNLKRLMNDQMNLWSFVAKTPGAKEALNDRIKKCLASR
jgi:hypothetical protein